MTTCGPYELIEPVGAGSSGTIYRARRAGEESAVVAVKVLQTAPPALWLDHLRAMSQTTNPHLCKLIEVGQGADGNGYIVYQFLSGGDLETARSRYDEQRVPLRTALRWIIDSLKGLGAIHQSDFLHGDIKPANLMLDDQGKVVVCDFTTLTPLHGPLALDIRNGTPEYMPASDGDLRSPQRDLYALGITLVGLLTGHLPETPEQAVPSRYDPLLPTTVDRIVARALATGAEPFASAQDMRHALEALLTGPEATTAQSSSVTSLSPPTRRVAWQQSRRKSPLWPWLVAVLMLPVGAWARGQLQAREPAPPASTALWSGVGVAPTALEQQLVWQVQLLGRPVLGFSASDPAAGEESAQERAQWCAAVLEEAHFQKRPLEFAYRREFEDSCDVYLVGEDWPEKFLFRVTPEESKLFDRKAPFIARAWCSLLVDTADLARPGARKSEKSAGALLLQPWQRRYETLLGQAVEVDQTTRVALWLEALDSLESDARNRLVESYSDLPEEPKS